MEDDIDDAAENQTDQSSAATQANNGTNCNSPPGAPSVADTVANVANNNFNAVQSINRANGLVSSPRTPGTQTGGIEPSVLTQAAVAGTEDGAAVDKTKDLLARGAGESPNGIGAPNAPGSGGGGSAGGGGSSGGGGSGGSGFGKASTSPSAPESSVGGGKSADTDPSADAQGDYAQGGGGGGGGGVSAGGGGSGGGATAAEMAAMMSGMLGGNLGGGSRDPASSGAEISFGSDGERKITNPMGSEDPSDYFSRLDPKMSIFQIVTRRYQVTTLKWPLMQAQDTLDRVRSPVRAPARVPSSVQ